MSLDEVRQATADLEISVTVKGSSPETTQQIKAVAHALARALVNRDPALRPLLREYAGPKVSAAACRELE